jgi:hypothetical protein
MAAAENINVASVRGFVIDSIKPHVPKTWKLFEYGGNLDALAKQPVLRLILKSISREPAAPLSKRSVTFDLELIEPNVDPQTREDALDQKLLDLLGAIDGLPSISWITAERGVIDNSNIGFTISLEVIVNK